MKIPFHMQTFKGRTNARIILIRFIKTEGGQRKGKLSVVKRKFVSQQDASYVAVETKSSSNVVKRLNYENKQLFGNILAAVKNTYESVTRPKGQRKRGNSAEILGTDSTIPVQGVDLLQTNNVNSSSTCGVDNPDLICKNQSNNISDNILEFPLINSKQLFSDAADSVVKLNYLREHIVSLCSTNSFPSITSVLEKTMPPERVVILERWKLNKIKEMGEVKFKEYQQGLLTNGASLHSTLNTYLSGTPDVQLKVQPLNVGHWSSLKAFLPHVKDVRLLEEHVEHPFLGYRGIVDCFASYKNNFVVIDWKTSEKQKLSINSTYDAPLQIAAYAGALNFDSRFNYKANKGLIAVAYNNGHPATIHYLNETTLLTYWKQWLKRLKTYWQNVENLQK